MADPPQPNSDPAPAAGQPEAKASELHAPSPPKTSKLSGSLSDSTKTKSKDKHPPTGTRYAPPPYIMVQPNLVGQFQCLGETIDTLRTKCIRLPPGVFDMMEGALTQSFCREMILRTEAWASELTRATSRFHCYPLGLPQDLMSNIGALAPLHMQGYPTVIADPDYVEGRCRMYLTQMNYGDYDEEGLQLSVCSARDFIKQALNQDVWAMQLPTRSESLLLHGIVTNHGNGVEPLYVTGPTHVSYTEEVRAAWLNHREWTHSKHGPLSVYLMKVELDTDNALAPTIGQYSVTAPIERNEYIRLHVVPTYYK